MGWGWGEQATPTEPKDRRGAAGSGSRRHAGRAFRGPRLEESPELTLVSLLLFVSGSASNYGGATSPGRPWAMIRAPFLARREVDWFTRGGSVGAPPSGACCFQLQPRTPRGSRAPRLPGGLTQVPLVPSKGVLRGLAHARGTQALGAEQRLLLSRNRVNLTIPSSCPSRAKVLPPDRPGSGSTLQKINHKEWDGHLRSSVRLGYSLVTSLRSVTAS